MDFDRIHIYFASVQRPIHMILRNTKWKLEIIATGPLGLNKSCIQLYLRKIWPNPTPVISALGIPPNICNGLCERLTIASSSFGLLFVRASTARDLPYWRLTEYRQTYMFRDI